MAEDKIEADDLSDGLLQDMSSTVSLTSRLRACRPVSAAELFAGLLTIVIEHGIVVRVRPTTEETFEVTSQWPVGDEDATESLPTWDAAYASSPGRCTK